MVIYEYYKRFEFKGSKEYKITTNDNKFLGHC